MRSGRVSEVRRRTTRWSRDPALLLEANRIRWYEALIAFFEKHLAPRPAGGAASPAS